MAEDRSIRVRFIAEYQSYVQGLRQASAATAEFGREVSGRGRAVQADVERVGRSALLMAGGMAAGLALSAKAAIDWETAWAGVTKTVDGTTAELDRLETGLRELALELPASHKEIAGVAEAAGQLGVGVNDVEEFTKVMIDLGETTNLTAQEAATSLARFSNIMGTSAADVERLGSTIVDLGNNSATTEAEILELATRLAAAGKIAGLSEADVFAFASTLTSVGVEAEAGGSALSKVFTSIRDAVLTGSDDLETFAEVAGVASGEFAAGFREDAAGAIALFIEGLGRMNAAGESTSQVFQDLSLTDQRLMRALLSTAEAGDLLTSQLGLAAGAWEENNALQTEAEKRYETTAAQLGMLRNQVTDVGIDIGQVLLPAVRGAIDTLGSLFAGIGELDGGMKAALGGVAGLSTALLGTVGILGTFGPKVAQARTALMSMRTAGQFVGRNMGRMATTLGLAGIALAAYTIHLGNQAKKQAEAEQATNELTEAIREQGTAIGELSLQVVGEALLAGDLGDSLRDLGFNVGIATTAIAEQGDALDDIDQAFLRYRSGAFATEAANAGMTTEMFGLTRALEEAGILGSALGDELLRLGESGELTADQMATLLDRIGDQGVAYTGAITQAENLAEAEDSAASAAREHASDAQKVKAAAEEEAAANEELIESIKNVVEARAAAVNPMFAFIDAIDANRDAQEAEAKAIAEGAEQIEEARSRVVEAERGLAEARSKPDNIDAIRAAEERLAEANENLAHTQAEAAITAEEQARFSREAAESARDVEAAAINLATAVETGSVSIETATGMLELWVEQGLITEEQAASVAEQFGTALGLANELGGDYVMSVEAQGLGDVVRLLERAWGFVQFLTNSPIDLQVQANLGGGRILRHSGGMVDDKGPFADRMPSGDEVATLLRRGEGVLNLKAMSMLGEAGLNALNAGQMFHHGGGSTAAAMGATSGPSYAYSTQNNDRSFHAPITVIGRPDDRTPGDIQFALRKLALDVSA